MPQLWTFCTLFIYLCSISNYKSFSNTELFVKSVSGVNNLETFRDIIGQFLLGAPNLNVSYITDLTSVPSTKNLQSCPMETIAPSTADSEKWEKKSCSIQLSLRYN